MRDLVFWNDAVEYGAGQVNETTFRWTITGAAAASPLTGTAALHTFGAIAAQATIDAHLGTTSEIDYLAFDATAMGADAFGGVVAMGGQVQELLAMRAICYSSTGGATKVERYVQDSATLTNSSLTTECAKGANGNIGFRVDFGNSPDFDGLTSGVIEITFFWRSK